MIIREQLPIGQIDHSFKDISIQVRRDDGKFLFWLYLNEHNQLEISGQRAIQVTPRASNVIFVEERREP